MKVEQILLFSPLKELWVEIEFTTGTRSIHVGALPPHVRKDGWWACRAFPYAEAISQMRSPGKKSSSYYRSQ